jgi:quinol-cytochrome oxidoreductase complex cytochrome b subunit
MGNNSTHNRILGWIDSRIGFTKTMLRPAPEHSLSPWYWLGALAVTAFLTQAVTGALMLLYYVPTVDGAYASTVYILGSVPLGLILETVHLYGAYAMVMLVFLHLVRGYFASVHKKPRELMWVVGMFMGLVTLGLGLTGYLLPWTVVSKSATDVTIGMLSFLPGQIGPLLKFLIAGAGSDADELRRFFDLHVVVLPGALLALLALKMYMFEIHGASEPASGRKASVRQLPWFPNVFLYLAMIGSVFAGILLAVSALFPISLPPEFKPQAAASFVPQPEWYFLWLYQVLKISVFEGAGIQYALGGTTILLIVITLLPFLDRGRERDLASRPFYAVAGIIAVAEVVALAIWGYFTPGKVIPNWEALTFIGGLALTLAILSWITFQARKMFPNKLPAGHSNASVQTSRDMHQMIDTSSKPSFKVGTGAKNL